MPRNDLLLRAARRERTPRTPVWLMRQAGRFDPQYAALREKADLELEDLFRNAELCAEISLLPKRFGVDAIIFFQDILTPLAPMGAGFVYRPGPVLERPVRSAAGVNGLRLFDVADELPFVAETLRWVCDCVSDELPVLGFAGAPLTLAAFLIEGCSPASAAPHLEAAMREDPDLLHRLLDKLTDLTVEYLKMQIEAGADAVQLFESAAHLLSHDEYERFAYPYQRRVFAGLGAAVPTILFVREQPFLELMAPSGADVLSVGRGVDLSFARRRFGDRVAFQGNVDNRLLAEGTPEEVANATRACILAGAHEGHILSLSHGVLKETPVENVVRMIDTAHSVRLDSPKELLTKG